MNADNHKLNHCFCSLGCNRENLPTHSLHVSVRLQGLKNICDNFLVLRIIPILFFLTGFLLACPKTSAEAASTTTVLYEGTISKSVIGADDNPVASTESTYSFQAEIALPLYRISVGAIKDLSFFEQVVGTDGVDVYLVHKNWPSWKDKAADTGRQEVAQVTPGHFPTLAVPEIQLVWTMIACHKILTNEPIILSHISYAPYDELTMKVQYAENGIRPAHVEVFSSGCELVQGNKYPLPPPFDKGYKLWELFLKDDSTVNAFSFSKKGEFHQYSVFSEPPTAGNAKLRRVRQIQITVTNAVELPMGTGAHFLPLLGQTNLMATDYRFSPKIPRPNMGEAGAIQYRLRDNKWLSRSNKIVNASGVSLKIETQTANLAAKPSGRRFGIIALLVVFSVGVVFFTVKKRQHS